MHSSMEDYSLLLRFCGYCAAGQTPGAVGHTAVCDQQTATARKADGDGKRPTQDLSVAQTTWIVGLDRVCLRRSGVIGDDDTRIQVAHILGTGVGLCHRTVIWSHEATIGQITIGDCSHSGAHTRRTKSIAVVIVIVIFIGVHDAVRLIVRFILTNIGHFDIEERFIATTVRS